MDETKPCPVCNYYHHEAKPCPACNYYHHEATPCAEPETPTCPACDYQGYSPSGFVVLSRGELECPACEGAGYHWVIRPESTDGADGGYEVDCDTCDRSGTVACGHEGQE